MSDSCDPMDCSLPGSSIHGIFQARVLEWGAIAFSQEENGWYLILLCMCLSPRAVRTVKITRAFYMTLKALTSKFRELI